MSERMMVQKESQVVDVDFKNKQELPPTPKEQQIRDYVRERFAQRSASETLNYMDQLIATIKWLQESPNIRFIEGRIQMLEIELETLEELLPTKQKPAKIFPINQTQVLEAEKFMQTPESQGALFAARNGDGVEVTVHADSEGKIIFDETNSAISSDNPPFSKLLVRKIEREFGIQVEQNEKISISCCHSKQVDLEKINKQSDSNPFELSNQTPNKNMMRLYKSPFGRKHMVVVIPEEQMNNSPVAA